MSWWIESKIKQVITHCSHPGSFIWMNCSFHCEFVVICCTCLNFNAIPFLFRNHPFWFDCHFRSIYITNTSVLKSFVKFCELSYLIEYLYQNYEFWFKEIFVYTEIFHFEIFVHNIIDFCVEFRFVFFIDLHAFSFCCCFCVTFSYISYTFNATSTIISIYFYFAVMEKFDCGNFHRACDEQ